MPILLLRLVDTCVATLGGVVPVSKDLDKLFRRP
jgi:hypothetical protein